MNVPNAITVVRLLLVPVFAWLQLTDRPLAAFVVFVSAAISDGIDGLLARLLDQRTTIGAILDPIADKLLGLTALFLLAFSGGLPVWLLLVSLLRDGTVFSVGLAAKLHALPVQAAPTRVSKYATFTLLTTISLALLSASPRLGETIRPWVATAGLIAAQCLLIATIQYVLLFRELVRAQQQGATRT